jgi:hypothetical protein
MIERINKYWNVIMMVIGGFLNNIYSLYFYIQWFSNRPGCRKYRYSNSLNVANKY